MPKMVPGTVFKPYSKNGAWHRFHSFKQPISKNGAWHRFLKIFSQRHKDRKGHKAFVRCLFFNLQKSRKNLRFWVTTKKISNKYFVIFVFLCAFVRKWCQAPFSPFSPFFYPLEYPSNYPHTVHYKVLWKN